MYFYGLLIQWQVVLEFKFNSCYTLIVNQFLRVGLELGLQL